MGVERLVRRSILRRSRLTTASRCRSSKCERGRAAIAINSSRAQTSPLRPQSRFRKANSVAVSLIVRSEEHTSELQSLMRISYAVFCLKKKKIQKQSQQTRNYMLKQLH